VTDPHQPPLRALQEDGDADIFAQTSVKEDTLSRRGTFVGCDNRLEISVQTHFFDSGSAAAVGGQKRTGQQLFARLATGGRKVERKNRGSNGCAFGEHEKEKALHRNCAKKRTEEETFA
jgi:hypothetical protein